MKARITAGEDAGRVGEVLSALPDRALLQLHDGGLLRVVAREDLEILKPLGDAQ